MFYRLFTRNSNGDIVFDTPDKLTAYGYIYYATSLSRGESYAFLILLTLLAVAGILTALFMIITHVSAIVYAYRHMYRNQTSRMQRSGTQTPNAAAKCAHSTKWSSPCFRGISPSQMLSCCFCRRDGQPQSCPSSSPPSQPSPTRTPTPSSPTSIRLASSTIPLTPKPTTSTPTPTTIYPLSTLTESQEGLETMTYPGVSIIKPLAGVDTNLEVNLISYFTLDYPNYELLFCVTDPTDPTCDLIRRLQPLYPRVKAQLIIANPANCVNPKIINLQTGYESSQFDLILVSDSGIWMRPDTLTDMVEMMQANKRIGFIHQVPFMTPHGISVRSGSHGGVVDQITDGTNAQTHFKDDNTIMTTNTDNPNNVNDITGNLDESPDLSLHPNNPQCSKISPHSPTGRPSFAWIVQLVFFGCWHAKIYLSAAFLGINCVTGMSCLLRKSVLKPIGGFRHFGCYLAEDFFLAKYFLDQGWQIGISHQPAWQNSPSTTLDQFLSRLCRWSQLRFSMVLLAYLLEPFSRCIPTAILSAFSFAYFLPDVIDPGVYCLCYILIWFLMDYMLLTLIYPPCVPLCITKFEYLVAWVLSELTAAPFHYAAAFKRDITWRNKRFRVHWGGRSEQVYPVRSIGRDGKMSCAQEQV